MRLMQVAPGVLVGSSKTMGQQADRVPPQLRHVHTGEVRRQVGVVADQPVQEIRRLRHGC
jgi:hypothetical protein